MNKETDYKFQYYVLSFGLRRRWGGPRKSARSCNGLVAVTRASGFGLGREEALRGLADGVLTLRTAWGDGGVFSLNPDAKEFIPEAGRVHHHARERYMDSRGSGEAGRSVGTRERQEEWECRRWPGRLHPVNGNQGAYRVTKRKATFVIHTLEKCMKKKKKIRRRGRA